MNKITLFLAIVAIATSSVAFFYPHSQLVYVDINKLVEGYARTQVERKAFMQKANTLKANVDSLLADWQKELKSYEKERASMTKKELELKQQVLQHKQQQLDNYQQAIQKQIREEDQKMTQTVLNDINDYVQEYGKKKGYRIIFGASGTGTIMYAEEVSDITQPVLDELNAAYQGS